MALVFLLSGCNKEREITDSADTIVYGKIYTARPDASDQDVLAEAMAIKDGRFVYVGGKAEADRYRTGRSRIIDCSGKGIVIPGITDGHAHYMMKYVNEQMRDNIILFSGQDTYEQVLDRVREFVEEARRSGRQLDYVYGEGYSLLNVIIDGRDLRHRKDLDAITTDIPIYLTGFDHHSTVVNTRAMVNAGIVDEDGNVLRDRIAGGFMYRDDEGKLNGVFAERAISLLQGPGLDGRMRPTSEQITRGIDNMQQYLHSVGITSIIEGWTNYYDKDDESLFQALTALDKEDKLHLNVSLTSRKSWSTAASSFRR